MTSAFGRSVPVLRRPVAPMLAAPVDTVPVGPDLLYEPKWDGWRAIAFREGDGVYLQSRAGRNLTPYFPDVTRAVRSLPVGVVVDGEIVVWERGRTSFAQLQRRVTAGHSLLRLTRECPAHFVLFDLLADAGGEVVTDAPLVERRARLAQLLTDASPQLTLTPQTDDMDEVGEWLTSWAAAGIEGVVTKRRNGRYTPGRRGWLKYRTRLATEAIVGGVTGSLHDPWTALLGRFDRRGRLRYTGAEPRTLPHRSVGNLAASSPRPSSPGVGPWCTRGRSHYQHRGRVSGTDRSHCGTCRSTRRSWLMCTSTPRLSISGGGTRSGTGGLDLICRSTTCRCFSVRVRIRSGSRTAIRSWPATSWIGRGAGRPSSAQRRAG